MKKPFEKNVHRAIMVVLLLALPATFLGCRHNVNTANPQVVAAATLLDASNATVTVEDGLTQAKATLRQLRASEPEWYAKVNPIIQRYSAANTSAAKKIQAATIGQPADWRAAMLDIAAQGQPSDFTAFGFKNPASQQLVSQTFKTLIEILILIPQKFGGAK